MTLSTLSAWIATGLVALAALSGWFLRRFARGAFIRRMRPHIVFGYAALAFALLHLVLTLGVGGTNATGIWLASLALFGLALQVFIGLNLQSPGGYRIILRRWHVVAFYATLVLIFGHIFLNAPFIPQSRSP